MPNRWGARALALGAALLLGAGAYFLGSFVGDKLANGFTFDWYVSPVAKSYGHEVILPAVGIAAALAALVAVGLVVGPAALLARWRVKANGYVAPRYRDPVSLDVHAGRLLVALGAGAALLAVLLAYVFLASPMLQGGALVSRVKPEGYKLLVAQAAALGAFGASLVAGLTTFLGVVDGRIVRESERNLIARVSLFGARHAKSTVAVVLVLTVVAGYYATAITTNVDVADVLPRGDPNTEAAHNLTQKFKSSFTQQVTFQFHTLDVNDSKQKEVYEAANRSLVNRRTEARPWNITDEVYVRAQAAFIQRVTSTPPFVGSVGAPDFYKLLNWTIAGGDSQNPANALPIPGQPAPNPQGQGNASFSLPPTDDAGEARYQLLEQAVSGGGYHVDAVYQAVDAVASPLWHQTAILVTVDPKDPIATRDIGEAGLAARDRIVAEADKRTDPILAVYGSANPPIFSVDLPIANAHASELTKHDFQLLLPIIAVFIAVTLFVAFRSVFSVVMSFSMLVVATTWTFGLMGGFHIALNTLNLAVVPLIMGVGIDYGIHMMNEYQEQRAAGRSATEAWTYAGGGSALALLVGTLTTIAGLLIMVVSPSLLVAQLGALAAFAISACFVLAILFIPALVTLAEGFQRAVGRERKAKREEYQPSRIMPAFATGVSRARWLVVVVLVLLAGAAIASAATIKNEAFGDPPRNWLASDPLRQEHEKAIQGFYDSPKDDVKANVLVFEGDMTDPAVHRYIAAITQTLRGNAQNGSWQDPNDGNKTKTSRVIGDTLKDLPFLVNTYVTVHNGVPGVGANAASPYWEQNLAPLGAQNPTAQGNTYPRTQAEIKATLDQAFASPLYQLANIFIDHPNYETAVTIFSVKAETYEDAAQAWSEVQAAVAKNDALKPAGTHVSFFGNTAINYLFVAKQVPWLYYMSIGTNIAVVLIVFAFTRDLRATLVVGLCNFLTSTVWLGVLAFMGIGLAISLTLPLIFIYCMGSDYGLHLALRCKRSKDTFVTFEGVGKGVLYSFVTTFGAFLVFTQISDLAGRRSMIATTLAIGIVFLVTLAIVPVVYPVKKGQRHGPERERNVPVVETRKGNAVQVPPK